MNDFKISPDVFKSNLYTGTFFTDIQKNVGEKNPIFLVVILLVLILYYFIFSTIGNNVDSNIYSSNGTGLYIIEVLLWSIFLFLLLINGLQYLFSMDVTAVVRDIFTTEPEMEISVETPSKNLSISNPKEVFHIPNNIYTYSDAKALCKAYNAELASYDQIKNAHISGAEWCSYGWSQDQMALFPTQSETYEKLKTVKGHEHDCGRPGINGGYIANENVKFGVNCYGYKPKITPEESLKMAYTEHYPKSKDDIIHDKKIEEMKKQIPEIMIAPFNQTRWNKI